MDLKKKFLLIYLFVAVLGLRCCAGFSLVVSGGYALVAVRGLLITVASLGVECRLSSCGPWAELLRGTWNLPGSGTESVCLLHWQVESLPLGQPLPLFSWSTPSCLGSHLAVFLWDCPKKPASWSPCLPAPPPQPVLLALPE